MSEIEPPIPDDGPSLKQRLKATRDRLIEGAATRMIDLGRQNPRLRRAGYWLYGTATRYLPRGREVGKFGSVGDTVFRGAQPSLRALKALKELGVCTVINLRPECDHERRIVEGLGMRYVYLPLPPLDAPSHETTLAFLSHATDPENGVVFFHCYHGVDRTGTMAACLRMARDGWSVEEALAEMRDYKVHESGQRAKVDYLAEFHAYWHGLPTRRQAEVLHTPYEEPTPPSWWQRAGAWLKQKLKR